MRLIVISFLTAAALLANRPLFASDDKKSDAGESTGMSPNVQGEFCPKTVTAPISKTGYDGTEYRVHYDFTRGKEQLNNIACGREYWITPDPKHKNAGVRFVYLVDGQRQRVSEQLYRELPDGRLEKD